MLFVLAHAFWGVSCRKNPATKSQLDSPGETGGRHPMGVSSTQLKTTQDSTHNSRGTIAHADTEANATVTHCKQNVASGPCTTQTPGGKPRCLA